jgi:O-antigen/teichoic acid export membrane protein
MIKKIISTFGIKVIIAAINLVIVILLSQKIGASGKGEASLIITSIALINIICSFIGGATLVFLVPRNNLFQLLFISYIWSFIICTGSYFVLNILNLIPVGFHVNVVILSFLSAVLSTNLTSLLGKEKIMSRNLLSLLQTVLNLFILVILFYLAGINDISAYIASLYIAFGTAALISFMLLLPHVKNIQLDGILPLIGKAATIGLYNQAGHVMQFLSLRISFFILLKYADEASVGIYSNGVSLAESIWLISSSMAMVQYARIANNENMQENRELTLKLSKASTIICILGIIPLILLPAEFYVWMFGPEFAKVKTVIYILAPGIIIYNLELIISHYFSGTGKYHINSIGNFVGLVVTIVLTLLFIPHYDIAEAALIATLSYAATAIFITWYFFRESGFNPRRLLPDSNDYDYIKLEVKAFFKQFK